MNTGTIHQLRQDKQPTVFKEGLISPNGITTRGQSIYIASFKDPSVVQLKMDGATVESVNYPASGLDGIAMTLDGNTYVSSWDSSSIYQRSPANEIRTLLTDIDAPADIGWDSKRNLLLVPLFKQNEVLIAPTAPKEY
jgi:glutamine cyclotransferase